MHCSTDGTCQGAMVGVRVAGPGHKDLRRADASEQVAQPVSEFVFVFAQTAIWEVQFEALTPGYPQRIEGSMPFEVTDFDDIVRAWPWCRRVPARPSVRGHRHRHWDATVRLLRHEKATSDGFVVLMWRQDQRFS